MAIYRLKKLATILISLTVIISEVLPLSITNATQSGTIRRVKETQKIVNQPVENVGPQIKETEVDIWMSRIPGQGIRRTTIERTGGPVVPHVSTQPFESKD